MTSDILSDLADIVIKHAFCACGGQGSQALGMGNWQEARRKCRRSWADTKRKRRRGNER